MVAFVGSFLVAILAMGAVVLWGKRRPPGAPLTWGEAIPGATFAFALMLWAYGVVPNQWLQWANNELEWSSANRLYGWHNFLSNIPIINTIKFSHETLSHIIVVGIYGFFLAAHVGLWSYWNDRGKRAEAAKQRELEPSTYGRPLVKQG